MMEGNSFNYSFLFSIFPKLPHQQQHQHEKHKNVYCTMLIFHDLHNCAFIMLQNHVYKSLWNFLSVPWHGFQCYFFYENSSFQLVLDNLLQFSFIVLNEKSMSSSRILSKRKGQDSSVETFRDFIHFNQ